MAETQENKVFLLFFMIFYRKRKYFEQKEVEMPKAMPGFQEIINEQKIKEEKEAENAKRKKLNLKEAEKKLAKKLEIISENFEKDGVHSLKQESKVAAFLHGFFFVNMLSFMVGSVCFMTNDGRKAEDYPYGHEPMFTSYDIYGVMSYGQAIKNAYLLDDWRNGNGGVFQGICGILSILMSIAMGAQFWKDAEEENKKKTKDASKLLTDLERLKDYNIDTQALLKDLNPSIKKILESLSEVDRGYFDNLIAGGLDKANYETCVAIVSGYLKSHPKEYNKVIGIFDEATLPEAIKKKYGKGKTISFAAAQELQPER